MLIATAVLVAILVILRKLRANAINRKAASNSAVKTDGEPVYDEVGGGEGAGVPTVGKKNAFRLKENLAYAARRS